MEFALAANDAMGNVVAIAEDDCRPGFHCELLWREGEIIDVHLHVRRANGHCRNGGESGGDKKCAGAAPGAKSQHAGSFLSTVSGQKPAEPRTTSRRFEDGFEYAGENYPSLTKIAKKITGAHWSGPRFFGLLAAGAERPSDGAAHDG